MVKLARFTGLLLTGLLSGLLACQGPDATQEQAKLATTPPGASKTPAALETPVVPPTVTAPAGLTGQVIAASDVAGQPDEPLPDQMVLAVPVAEAERILGPGSASLPDERLRFLKADLPQPDPAISVTLTNAAGEYTLQLDPGAYILCVADSEQSPPDFPARTRGCGRTEVPPGELRTVDVSSGFGEILLIER